jgi:predicted DNA binding CopG/RHH family protein
MKTKIPTFKSDRAAAQLTRFEIKPKDKSINLRLYEDLYNAFRKRASRAGFA